MQALAEEVGSPLRGLLAAAGGNAAPHVPHRRREGRARLVPWPCLGSLVPGPGGWAGSGRAAPPPVLPGAEAALGAHGDRAPGPGGVPAMGTAPGPTPESCRESCPGRRAQPGRAPSPAALSGGARGPSSSL